MNVNEVSELCKVLSDPHRIHILQMLVSGEKCASELLEKFTISQPTLSHHMKTMTDSGLLQEKKRGKRTYYSIDHRTWDEFMLVLDTISSKDYWPWFPPAVLKENAEGKPAAAEKKAPAASEKPAEKESSATEAAPAAGKAPETKQTAAAGKTSRKRTK